MQILLIEDDRRIADLFTRGLTEEGHRVEHVTDLLCAQARLELSELDLRIGDRLLPDGDGLALVLTALDRVEDRVEGLSGGADDSLTKPFAFEEPPARITRALPPRRLTVGDRVFNSAAPVYTPAGTSSQASAPQASRCSRRGL